VNEAAVVLRDADGPHSVQLTWDRSHPGGWWTSRSRSAISPSTKRAPSSGEV